ncbi:ABC transporter substrate-binding protein [Ferviditalea candida]|uniref:ABC transporter substrate-binding protein n=1 Tax=Ferviditalea candida TaxID=3108399 RepID=A0ABU5ZDI5_9BACL|nr:ABC transporter substrate-binding protein [Paenibacillaceae bacterium T2]
MSQVKEFYQKHRNAAALLFLSLLLVFVTACGSNSGNSSGADSNKPIKIGVLVSMSGPFSSGGEGIKKGIELYLKMNGNKINNRNVETVYEDDENNPQVALRKFNKLVDSDHIDVLLGGISTTVVSAISDAVNQNKIPFIIVNAGSNEMSWSKKSDYIYRASFSNYQYGDAAGTLIAQNIAKKAYVLMNDYPAGHEQADAFEKAFKAAGGTDLKMAYPPLGASDFATYITEITNYKPDVVYSAFGGSDGVRFALQYASFGLKGKIPLVSQVADDQITSPEIKNALDNEYAFTSYYSQIDNEANKSFVKAYQEQYNEAPANFMELGYESAQIIGKSIEEAGSTKPEDLIKKLMNVSIASPRGNHVMDPNTHNQVIDFYLLQFKLQGEKVNYDLVKTQKEVKMPEKP